MQKMLAGFPPSDSQHSSRPRLSSSVQSVKILGEKENAGGRGSQPADPVPQQAAGLLPGDGPEDGPHGRDQDGEESETHLGER